MLTSKPLANERAAAETEFVVIDTTGSTAIKRMDLWQDTRRENSNLLVGVVYLSTPHKWYTYHIAPGAAQRTVWWALANETSCGRFARIVRRNATDVSKWDTTTGVRTATWEAPVPV